MFGCEIYNDAECLYCFGADSGDKEDIENMYYLLRKSKSDYVARLFRYLDISISMFLAKVTIDYSTGCNGNIIKNFLADVEKLRNTFITEESNTGNSAGVIAGDAIKNDITATAEYKE